MSPDESPCRNCGGTGEVEDQIAGGTVDVTCSPCRGTGIDPYA